MRSVTRSVCLVLLTPMLALAAWSAPSAAQTTTAGTPQQRAAALARPAIVYLEQYWSAWVRVPRGTGPLGYSGWVNGKAFAWGTRCSGFVVAPSGYIVTAGHCVDTGDEGARGAALEQAIGWFISNGYIRARDASTWLGYAHMNWSVEGDNKGAPPDLAVWMQRGVAAGGLKTGEALPARVVDFQPWSQGDVALLKVEAQDLPTLLLGDSTSIDVGVPVMSIGYPGSTDLVTDQTYEPTFKDGEINAKKTREGGLLPVYEMSAALSGGMSGGPTVNLDGDVVGVNSFNINGETEAFNFITPSSLVSEMLARNGLTNALGQIDQAYRAGIDAFFAGDYATAIDRFDEVLALSPTHQQAQEFRVEAEKAVREQPASASAPGTGGGGVPAWAIAAIVAGVVVLAVLAVVTTRRRRPAPAAAAVALERPVAAISRETPPAGGTPAVPTPEEAAANPAPSLRSVPDAEPAHFCATCGHPLERDAHFCAVCGHRIAAA